MAKILSLVVQIIALKFNFLLKKILQKKHLTSGEEGGYPLFHTTPTREALSIQSITIYLTFFSFLHGGPFT